MATTTETGATKFAGAFRWGRSGEANIEAKLSRNEHGWFCDEINGHEWEYPGPFSPSSGWGHQFASRTPLEAVRSFLRHWDAAEGDVATAADRLTIRPTTED